jgi:hypothetical protein
LFNPDRHLVSYVYNALRETYLTNIIVAILATFPLSKTSNGAQLRWIERVQARLTVVSSMLHDMKAVKMLGISDKLFESVSGLRKEELKASERFRVLILWQVAICRPDPLDW